MYLTCVKVYHSTRAITSSGGRIDSRILTTPLPISKGLYNSSAFIPLPPEDFPAPGHGGSKPDIPRICYPADWAVDRSALHSAVRAFLKAAEYSLSASPAFLAW
jgi:hypothetical protein